MLWTIIIPHVSRNFVGNFMEKILRNHTAVFGTNTEPIAATKDLTRGRTSEHIVQLRRIIAKLGSAMRRHIRARITEPTEGRY